MKATARYASLGALGLLGTLWWFASRTTTTHAEANPAPPATPPTIRAATASDAGGSWTPPPIGTPLASALPDLTRAAKSNRDAACRLASELAKCHDLQMLRIDHERWLGQKLEAINLLSGSVKADATETLERESAFREGRMVRLEEHCSSVSPPTPVENAANWRHAATLGNTAAISHYVLGSAFPFEATMDLLPELNMFRAQAPSLAFAAARSGDLEVALALANAYSPLPSSYSSLLRQSVKPDAAQALALYQWLHENGVVQPGLLAAPLRSEIATHIARLEESASQDVRDRAHALFTKMRTEWDKPKPRQNGQPLAGERRSARILNPGACGRSA